MDWRKLYNTHSTKMGILDRAITIEAMKSECTVDDVLNTYVKLSEELVRDRTEVD